MTAHTIDRKERIAEFIKTIENIANNTELDKKELYGKRHSEIANECTNEKRYLGEGKSDKQAGKKPKLAQTTYASYLTDYRNAIKALNKKGLNTDKDILRIKKAFKKYDLSMLDAKMPKLQENIAELEKKYIDVEPSLYAKLKKLKIYPHAYYLMRVNLSVANSIKAKNSEQLITKHTAQKVVNIAHISQILNDLDKSDHWADLAIFVALASGRRAIEVLKEGSFKKGKKNHVLFTGQAKTKGREDVGAFIIPTLVTNDRLIKAHNKLKEELSKIPFYEKNFNDLTPEEVNGGTAGRLNRKVKSILGEEFTFKDLRATYAKRASEIYHDDTKTSTAVFYSMILGHSERDIATQLSYQGIVISAKEISTSKIEFSTDEPKRDTSNQKTLDEIAAFDEEIEERKSKAEIRIHAFVKKALRYDKETIITQSFLGKPKEKGGAGASRPAIKKYLELVGIK